jgi:quercetin dioxygenase-like cupin family protein
MIKNNLRVFVVLSVLFFLHAGCAMVRGTSDGNEASLEVNTLVKTTRSWNGEVLPAYPQGQAEVTILRIRIPSETRLDTHKHPVINAGVLLRGQLTVVTKEGKILHLKAGDPIVEVVNTWHYGINEGETPAEIVVFYAGVVDTPITILEPQ